MSRWQEGREDAVLELQSNACAAYALARDYAATTTKSFDVSRHNAVTSDMQERAAAYALCARVLLGHETVFGGQP